jgi:hypothetical protein
MQFNPTKSELFDLSNMNEAGRLQYFLLRTLEAEEIWGLANQQGWILREINNKTILQVWPYEQLADDYATAHDEIYQPTATSLDHFVHNLLSHMVDQDIEIEILPINQQAGKILTASELHEVFNSLLETGEYYLEG